MTKSNAFLLVQCTAQEISLLLFHAVANESQCNSDQTSDLEKHSDQHPQNFHSPRGHLVNHFIRFPRSGPRQ